MVRIGCINEDEGKTCLFTPFSLVHIVSGAYLVLLFKFLGCNDIWSFISMNLVHFIYELKDWHAMYRTGQVDPESYKYNTWVNSIGDQISAILGAFIILKLFQDRRISADLIIKLTIGYVIIGIVAWVIGWGFLQLG